MMYFLLGMRTALTLARAILPLLTVTGCATPDRSGCSKSFIVEVDIIFVAGYVATSDDKDSEKSLVGKRKAVSVVNADMSLSLWLHSTPSNGCLTFPFSLVPSEEQRTGHVTKECLCMREAKEMPSLLQPVTEAGSQFLRSTHLYRC